MPLLDTLPSHLRMFRASPECFRSQPPKAAEFISPARQRWERIVLDGKPRRGDIQSNRRSLLTLPPPGGSVTPRIEFTLTRAVF